MNIVIDIGNTAIKLAVFNDDKLVWIWKGGKALDLKLFSKKQMQFSHSIISSVARTPEKLYKLLSSKTTLVRFSHTTPLPYINRYKTPATLGLDRIASVAGAQKRFPRKNVLVIDAGTCIKYDFINKKGEYLGGSISPGLHMRFNALHNFTDRLPLIPLDSAYKFAHFSKKKNPTGLIKPEKVNALTGDSTKNSILTGVIFGMTNEINGFISQYKSKYPELKVILTGGDADFLGRQLRTLEMFPTSLKSSIFAAPYLTLEGLNEILNYNADGH